MRTVQNKNFSYIFISWGILFLTGSVLWGDYRVAQAETDLPTVRHSIGEKCPMSETFTITRPEGDLSFTLETLEAIKQKLLEALKQKQPPNDYAHLIREVEDANPVVFENVALIGGWNLIHRNNELLLEHQQMPRTPLMLFYEAPLAWRDGQWQVLSINRKKVRGR
jgi:hypothetical protein